MSQTLREAVVDVIDGTVIRGCEPNRDDNGLNWTARMLTVADKWLAQILLDHDARLRAALIADRQTPSNEEALRNALQDLVDVADIAPEPNCSCHLSPPCSDCVEWSGLREAIAHARSILTKPKGNS